MFGSGVLKGLGVTLKEFLATYIDDIKQVPSRYSGGKQVIDQSNVGEQDGLFTIQYPEERRKLPERFRYIPMLLYETNAETNAKEHRCTACGICAKVCPPQCIWIVRDKDENGKPITRPAEFHIDASICMNCGLCAEFCPFDAIKMNHDFEIAAFKRMPHLIFDLEELSVPVSYYARIRPTDYAEEEAVRKAKESEKAAAKPAEKPARPAAAAPAAAPAAVVAPAPAAETPAAAPARRSPEEIERLKAEAAARRAAKAEGGEPAAAAPPPPAPAGEAPAGVGSKRSPEEIERLKAEAAARRAAKAAGEAAPQAEAAPPPAAPPSAAPPSAAPPSAAPPSAAPPSAAPPSAAPPSAAPTGRNRSPEEIERLKAEAAARRAARAAQDGKE